MNTSNIPEEWHDEFLNLPRPRQERLLELSTPISEDLTIYERVKTVKMGENSNSGEQKTEKIHGKRKVYKPDFDNEKGESNTVMEQKTSMELNESENSAIKAKESGRGMLGVLVASSDMVSYEDKESYINPPKLTHRNNSSFQPAIHGTTIYEYSYPPVPNEQIANTKIQNAPAQRRSEQIDNHAGNTLPNISNLTSMFPNTSATVEDDRFSDYLLDDPENEDIGRNGQTMQHAHGVPSIHHEKNGAQEIYYEQQIESSTQNDHNLPNSSSFNPEDAKHQIHGSQDFSRGHQLTPFDQIMNFNDPFIANEMIFPHYPSHYPTNVNSNHETNESDRLGSRRGWPRSNSGYQQVLPKKRRRNHRTHSMQRSVEDFPENETASNTPMQSNQNIIATLPPPNLFNLSVHFAPTSGSSFHSKMPETLNEPLRESMYSNEAYSTLHYSAHDAQASELQLHGSYPNHYFPIHPSMQLPNQSMNSSNSDLSLQSYNLKRNSRAPGQPTNIRVNHEVDTDTLKRMRNKVSASRCRVKKKMWMNDLEERNEFLKRQRARLEDKLRLMHEAVMYCRMHFHKENQYRQACENGQYIDMNNQTKQ